jgi:putative endonuclease
VEQLVARWAHNPKVTGSSPVPATRKEASEIQGLLCFSMFTVYILYSLSYNKTYVGYTADMEARFKSHNELATKGWTINFRPWQILHTEVFDTKSEAMKREAWFKSGIGRQFIKDKLLPG